MARPFWDDHAACKDTDVALFYGGVDGMPQSTRMLRAAKKVCATCPVRVDCLVTALNNQDKHGVWGGTTRNERMRLMARTHDDVQAAVAQQMAKWLLEDL